MGSCLPTAHVTLRRLLIAMLLFVMSACGDGSALDAGASRLDPQPADSLTGTRSVPEATTTTGTPENAVETDPVRVAPATVGWASASVADRPAPQAGPIGLQIPKLGVAAPVVAMGIDADGKMEVPGNVEDVAWYEFGASPGEAGSAVLAAHVDLAGSGPGVFFDIDTLSPGDAVAIAFDDGSLGEFVVEKVERIAKSALDVGALFDRTGSARVRLVTCGGDFNPDIRRYNDNVIVTLVPVTQQ